MALIIVESPTKARTFNRILHGKDFYVFASMGHIRDLPPTTMSIDTSKNFSPSYETMKKKERVIAQLKELASKNDEIILATDPDREGEAISYHVAYILGYITENWPDFKIIDDNKKLKRIVFHEITSRALEEALANPQELRVDLIKAQQARRILDRLVGYELSPLLWKKTGKNWLSAGRVQTVALRLIVEREKERRVFTEEQYFNIFGLFQNGEELRAKLTKIAGQKVEVSTTLKLYAGDYTYTKTTIGQDKVKAIVADMKTDSYTVTDTSEEVVKRYPPPPHTTSLLQQDAYFKHGFSSKMVMSLAQDLYERGLITYHRTDSFNLSTQFVFKARDYIGETFGKEYVPEKPRGYKTKSRNAQEAHEAIRPTKLVAEPKISKDKDKRITVNHRKLYKLIFDRAVATQMREAEVKVVKLTIGSKKQYELETQSQQVMFDGFLRILNPDFVSANTRVIFLKKGSPLTLANAEEKEQKTVPPPRYNDATLIKIMEEMGIGRPSTYAPIITLIQEKGYVEKDGRYFMPTNLGEPISEFLAANFPTLFDLSFTSGMEEGLDEIANGTKNPVALLKDFYGPFQKQLALKMGDSSLLPIKEDTTEACPKCAKPLIVRFSRFGKFYACSGYPACRFTKPFLKIIKGKKCPKCGGDVVIKYTKTKKHFYGCSNYPKCTFASWTIKDIK